MFKLSRKKVLLKTSIIGIVIVATAFAAVSFKIKQLDVATNAATADGTEVFTDITHEISYGIDDGRANVFSLMDRDGNIVGIGQCVNPSKNRPYNWYAASKVTSNSVTYQKIKLLIYLSTVKNTVTDAFVHNMFSITNIPNPTDDQRFAYIHATLGWIYEGNAGTLHLDANWKNYVKRFDTEYLQPAINNKEPVWTLAERYQLYMVSPGGSYQDIMWIEDKNVSGSITVNKKASDTTECVASFNTDVKFSLINKTGLTVSYNGRNYANNSAIVSGASPTNCTLTWSGLPYGNYEVQESVTDGSTTSINYEIDSAKNVSLTSSSASVTFTNTRIQHSSVTVRKRNQDTNECMAPFINDVKFSLINSAGVTLYSNSSLDSSCNLKWDELPYDTYTIKESYSGNDYLVVTETQTATTSDTNLDVTVDFLNAPVKVPLTVSKIDSDTGTCTPSGNLSIVGTAFELYSNNNFKIKYNGQIYDNGAKIDTKAIEAGQCSVVFENLPRGNYTVKEVSAPAGYTISTDQKSVSITGSSASESFTNTPKKGKITINKVDAETNSCSTKTEKLSFAGTTFKVVNKSTNPIKYNDTLVNKDATILTKVFSATDCSFVIDGLPYGTYLVEETVAPTGYSLADPVTVTIPTDDSINLTRTIKNQPIRGDLVLTKKDSNNNKVIPNALFSITALESTGDNMETHYVVTDENGVINTASNPHSNHTNGYDVAYDNGEDITYAGYGTWFGRNDKGEALPVNDALGALPYGKYMIEEMRCDANKFCYEIEDQKKIFTVSTQNQVVNLGEWDNECAEFSLGTEAVDAKDEDKYVEALKTAKIIDHVNYCAKPDYKFTIKGVLMDKTTNEPLMINGSMVEQSLEITPEQACGSADLVFEFDGTGLGGHDLVVFETMYYENEVVASHEDINDEFQTIEMVYLHTLATNKENGEKILPPDQDVEIKDTVKYCLKPGLEYTVKGIVMDKVTGNSILYDNKSVEQEVTFTPEESCGELDMFYAFNTTGLGGKKIVIFESLYRDNELLLKHEDLENVDEAMDVELPAPDTGLFTKDETGLSVTSVTTTILIISSISFGGYLVARRLSRKKSLKF
ncbi:VaFE repeat-containing surface-anchored protein [Candidatus Saccharibacteria bacterium]|nr:VaFE repeat-containing surface-anchored protein [Candidatus Saccharibacteria bacterium]